MQQNASVSNAETLLWACFPVGSSHSEKHYKSILRTGWTAVAISVLIQWCFHWLQLDWGSLSFVYSEHHTLFAVFVFSDFFAFQRGPELRRQKSLDGMPVHCRAHIHYIHSHTIGSLRTPLRPTACLWTAGSRTEEAAFSHLALEVRQ